jgi:adenylate cyclase, class 2
MTNINSSFYKTNTIMGHINIEFKALANNVDELEARLVTLNPKYIGEDNQKDTYYNVSDGRLKLREGNIENALIWYSREDFAGAKQSNVLLYKHLPDATLKTILEKIHGIKVIVDKKRRIYFIENVKFHFDRVEGLGTFVEVEAIDNEGSIGKDMLTQQCNYYAGFFDIKQSDFIEKSYSDLLLEKN